MKRLWSNKSPKTWNSKFAFFPLTSPHLFASIGTQHCFRIGSYCRRGLLFKGELPGVTWEKTPNSNFNEEFACFPSRQNLKSESWPSVLSGSPGQSWVVSWLQAFLSMNKHNQHGCWDIQRIIFPFATLFYGIFKKLACIHSFFSAKKLSFFYSQS